MVKVDTVSLYHRGDGVEEMEALATQALEDIVGERVTGQRPRRNEGRAVAFKARDFFAVERDIRALRNLFFYGLAEDIAVHGKRIAIILKYLRIVSGNKFTVFPSEII